MEHAPRRSLTPRSVLMLDPLLLAHDGAVLARVADISTDGALIFGKGEPPAAGSVIRGRLDAPALGNGPLPVALEVRWSAPDAIGGWFRAGCQFPEGSLDEQGLESIARLVAAWGVSHR